MTDRPKAVTAISWFAMGFSAVVVTMFLLRIVNLASYEVTSISAVVWWFVLGLFPLYFVSGLFMLRGRDWARQLCVAVGASSIVFGIVVSPFTIVTACQVLYLAITTALLYTAPANLFFRDQGGVRRRLSLVSLLLGAFAIGLSATASYLKSAHMPGSGASLEWLTKMGLARQTRSGESVITEASVFAVNDENALVFLTALAILLAAIAMVLASIAEYRREPTLYLSAGYISGALALLLFKPLVGLAAMMVGIVVLLVLRHERRAQDDA